MSNIVPLTNSDAFRASTDAAGLCRDIVLKTAKNIQGRKYVCVEGWQAIAIAHGCTASADHVERITDEGMSGFRATGIVRRMSDGAEIARAEGFLGDDENVWSKRPVYARRAMVQTRAISRACRSAFAHVVVMLDAGLQTTPAEEVPDGGFQGNVQEGEFAVVETKSAKPGFPEGPCTGISNLKVEIRKMKDLGNKASSLEAFEQVAKEYELHRKQLEDLEHEWWTGVDKGGNTYESVPAWLDRRRAELSEPDHLQILLDAMRENHTKQALTMWAANQEMMIDGLPDDKRRQFEAEYDAYDAGLQQVATVAAG